VPRLGGAIALGQLSLLLLLSPQFHREKPVMNNELMAQWTIMHNDFVEVDHGKKVLLLTVFLI
jgi:hypothetical protein